MLHNTGLPKSLWAECICHVVWLKNWTLTQALKGKTLYKATFKRKPNMANVPDWGAQVFVLKKTKSKL
ncbi:hypothetical protein BT96DRAFT_767866, partial [Gymnopus androsaceus JB14]